jgi:thiol:disulfide interchange protein
MFGSNLGELDAFVQPARDRDNLAASAAGAGRGPVWMQNQYRAALELARSEHKLVLVDFTGYGCTNCHWMEANLFPQAEVASAMKDFVLRERYTDGSDEQSRQNQDLELSRFNTVAIPSYATLDPDEKVLATVPGLTKNPREYFAFLRKSAKPDEAAEVIR